MQGSVWSPTRRTRRARCAVHDGLVSRRVGAVRVGVALVLGFVVGVGCSGETTGLVGDRGGLSADEEASVTTTETHSPGEGQDEAVVAYLDEVLAIIERDALNAERIDWDRWRTEAAEVASAARSTEATYDFVRDLVDALEDDHSSFILASDFDRITTAMTAPPTSTQPVPVGELDDNGIGYLRLPGFPGGDPTSYIATAHEILDADACGWIVDLTSNPGGGLFPMLAALAPLLGEGPAISYTYRDGTADTYEIASDGSLTTPEGTDLLTATGEFIGFRHATAPIAVIQGPGTASAGEGALIALRGRGARTYGRPSFGVPTGNELRALPDGSAINLTTAAGTDPDGNRYLGPIPPDIDMPDPPPTIRADAEAWLLDTPACGSGSGPD